MTDVILDGRTIDSSQVLHRQLSQALHFPEWYGGNLDALFDCLTDLHEDTRITLLHFDQLTLTLGRYASSLLRVLCQAEQDNPHIHLTLEMQEPS